MQVETATGDVITLRKWQAEAVPLAVDAMRQQRRGIISAVMGSGKSVAMALVVLQALPKLQGRAVVVTAPRAALVEQLAETLRWVLGAEHVGRFYGEAKEPDRDVIVACNRSALRLAEVLRDAGRRVVVWIADEAHSTETDTVKAAEAVMRPVCRLGFTATPFRSLPKQVVSLFDEILYRYTLTDAVRDGVLVPLRFERWRGDAGVPVDDALIEMAREHCKGPGIVSANDIADAELYALRLVGEGFKAEAIHSDHSPTKRAEKVERLRSGELDVLVHVSLLAEGVDFPWLRWIGLRRNVQARVRFLQEVGRVGRTDPQSSASQWGEKVDGVVLDPHLILGRFGITSTEALARALEDAAEAEAREGSVSRTEPTEAEALALDQLVTHLAAVRDGMQSGRLVEGRREPHGAWRLLDVSQRQVDAVKRVSKLTRHVPTEHREAVRSLVKVPWALTRGAASDLLDVLHGGARWAREVAADQEERTGKRPYPTQLQWEADMVSDAPPGHKTCLAAGRAGRKAGRAGG